MIFKREPYRSLLITTLIYIVFFSILLLNEFEINLLNFNNSVPIELTYEFAGSEEQASPEPQIPEQIITPVQQSNVIAVETDPDLISFNAAPVESSDTSAIIKNDSTPGIVGDNTNQEGGDSSLYVAEGLGIGEGGSDLNDINFLNSQHAKFLGEDKDRFGEWLKTGLQSNETILAEKTKGQYKIAITIDKEGKLKNPKIIKGDNDIVKNEILKLVKQSPLWEPAKQQNHPVEIIYTMEINF
jgi:hypothetical protein